MLSSRPARFVPELWDHRRKNLQGTLCSADADAEASRNSSKEAQRAILELCLHWPNEPTGEKSHRPTNRRNQTLACHALSQDERKGLQPHGTCSNFQNQKTTQCSQRRDEVVSQGSRHALIKEPDLRQCSCLFQDQKAHAAHCQRLVARLCKNHAVRSVATFH